jgi:hypothetical protein
MGKRKVKAFELPADVAEMQANINSGLAWRLEGHYGREAMRALEAGACMLGPEGMRDYWGNYVPSRSQVQAGTKGSPELVREQFGDEWADALEAIGGNPHA